MAKIVASVKGEIQSWLTSLGSTTPTPAFFLSLTFCHAGAGEVSQEFFDLIKAIGEARSKQEEHGIMEGESRHLKQALKTSAPGSGANKGDDARLVRELLVRFFSLPLPVPLVSIGPHIAFYSCPTGTVDVIFSSLLSSRFPRVFLLPLAPLTSLAQADLLRDARPSGPLWLHGRLESDANARSSR